MSTQQPPQHDNINNGNKTDQSPLPTGAQIPLQSFQLPAFPPEAANLQALTLTSDIKLPDYSTLLTTAIPADAIPPSLPGGIESLTLELFSLGYAPPFLSRLGKALGGGKLRSLTVFSQLIDGVGEESRKDAGEFFAEVLAGLREVHLLDVFCRRGFMRGIGGLLEELYREDSGGGGGDGAAATAKNEGTKKSDLNLRFLEISYTYRGHSDRDFLNRIPGDELPTLLVPSIMAVSFSLNAPPSPSSSGGDDADDDDCFPHDPADVDEEGKPIPGKKPEGIIPLPHADRGTEMLVRKLAGGNTNDDGNDGAGPDSVPGPVALKMLESTLYTFDTEQLTRILKVQKDMGVLSASVLVEPTVEWKGELVRALRGGVGVDGSDGDGDGGGKELEIVEVVGVPSERFDREVSSDSNATTSSILEKVFPSAADMALISKYSPRLESFRMTILRAASFGYVEWNKVEGTSDEWVGGIKSGAA
ncbi:hypothetical protein AJ79_05597 [Helicocarpus griseus UAMH5409]|uniref:Uncharacterized protein n=1 Tax=Helicocarpus griseus UAMH5409 TaxID=1447875 RepID=A0A2B7XLQ7_9EURO|nr:hypothetical protein AJ79_05597 [Helicocarpus griseus UAMH5409]